MFHPDRLAETIRACRRARGMRQADLAAVLQISPQSVSKWERGLSAPDIDNLCRIAQALGVSADTLLRGTSPHTGAMIGIDGGGSKTEFVLFSPAGDLLARRVLGACNPNAIGMEACIALLRQGIDEMRRICGDIRGVYVGAAGFLTGGNGDAVRSILAAAYPGVQIGCGTDILNVIASATDSETCIAAICGTGSVVFAREKHALTKLTGWGYLLSSGGSGYDIGRAALRAALGDAEGLSEHTLITRLVEARLGAPAETCVQEVYRNDSAYVASFAPLVFDAFDMGDAVADNILNENALSLASVINHASRKYDCGTQVILSGGLVTGRADFAGRIRSRLDPQLTVHIPDIPQVLGACRLCARMCGAFSPEADARLIRQYREGR